MPNSEFLTFLNKNHPTTYVLNVLLGPFSYAIAGYSAKKLALASVESVTLGPVAMSRGNPCQKGQSNQSIDGGAMQNILVASICVFYLIHTRTLEMIFKFSLNIKEGFFASDAKFGLTPDFGRVATGSI